MTHRMAPATPTISERFCHCAASAGTAYSACPSCGISLLMVLLRLPWPGPHSGSEAGARLGRSGRGSGGSLSVIGRHDDNAGWRLLGDLLTGWNIRFGGVLAQLQSTNVGGDRPAVLRRDLSGIVGHGAKAIGHNVKEISDRGLAQTVRVVRRRALITTLHDHAVAVAEFRVAGRTVDVEALLSARHHLGCHRKGHVIAIVTA